MPLTLPKIPTFRADVLDKIENGFCPYCGRDGFIFVGRHIEWAHHILAKEVREEFGFNRSQPLCIPEYSEKHSKLANLHTAKVLTLLATHRPMIRSKESYIRTPQCKKEFDSMQTHEKHRQGLIFSHLRRGHKIKEALNDFSTS